MAPPVCCACRMYQIVKLLYCFGILITYALQFYVPAEILIPQVVRRVSGRLELVVDLSIRVALVTFTCKRHTHTHTHTHTLSLSLYLSVTLL